METKKQEAIRLAYIGYWDIVKDFVDENGWIKYSYGDPIEAGVEPFGTIGYQTKNQYLNQYEWRPIALNHLENNNEWIAIESKEQLHKLEKGLYELGNGMNYFLVLSKTGHITVDSIGKIRANRWLSEYTHYQPIRVPNKPLY